MDSGLGQKIICFADLGLIALIAVIGVPKLTIVQVKQQQDKK
jgi:hypothetical protein